MPRTPRMIIGDETAVYHVMSRTALDGFPLGDIEKDFMLDLIRRYSKLYFVEILGFCLMGNHFHLLVKMFPESNFTDKEFNVKSEKERVRAYRRYVCEAGAVNRPEKGNVKVIEDKILRKERRREFELSKSDRLRYRTRYFTDSGIIGSKEFVSANYHRFKNLFNSKHEKNQSRSGAWMEYTR